MAARTTAQAGDWNTGATWTGGVKAVSGDTATINHAVTVSTNETVGTSPAADTTTVLTINAALTIQSTGTLHVRGATVQADVAVTVDGDGILEIDASQAATRRYRWRIGTANNQANCYLVANGSSGHPAIIRSNSSGNAGWFDGGNNFTRGGKFKLTFANLTKIGDGTNQAFDYDLNSSSSDSCWADDCIFDNCAGVFNTAGAVADGATFRLLRTTWKNGASNLSSRFGSNLSFGSGTRSVTFCVFDIQPTLFNGTGFTIDDNIFYEAPSLIGTAHTSFARNLVRLITAVAPMTTIGTMTDCYILYDEPAASNPHFLGPDSGGASHDYDGLVFEFTGSAADGDCILPQTPGSAMVHRATRCLIIPNAAGGKTGTFFTLGGNANVKISVDHCTYYADGVNSGVVTGEGSYGGYAGMVDYLKNSIIFGPVAGTGFKEYASTDSTPANDIVSAANADYNCGFQLAAGAEGKGYDTPMTGTPGAHDVQQDPQFYAPTRRTTTFDTSLGGAGTVANLLTELMKRNDRSGWDIRYTVPALFAYVRQGFIPLNAAVRGTALDGTVMGAVQDAPPGVTAVPLPYRQPVPMRRGPRGLNRGTPFRFDTSIPPQAAPPEVIPAPPPYRQPVPMRRGPRGLNRGQPFEFATSSPVQDAPAAGSSPTVSLATAAQASIAAGAGASVSQSEAQGTGVSIAAATGLSESQSLASGSAASIAAGPGQSESQSLASASGASFAAADGSAPSVSLALAVGAAIQAGATTTSPAYQMVIPMRPGGGGLSIGRPFRLDTANPVPPSGSIASGAGIAAGGSLASGAPAATASAAGNSLSYSLDAGAPAPIAAAPGLALSTGTDVGSFQNVGQGTGAAFAPSLALGVGVAIAAGDGCSWPNGYDIAASASIAPAAGTARSAGYAMMITWQIGTIGPRPFSLAARATHTEVLARGTHTSLGKQ